MAENNKTTKQREHYKENVICPKCKSIEIVGVHDTGGQELKFIHKCTKCGHIIKQGYPAKTSSSSMFKHFF